MLRSALDSGITDFEDAVLEKAAELAGLDFIITANVRDFRKSVLPAFTPEQVLAMSFGR